MEEAPIIERNPIHGRFKGASWYGHPQSIIIGGAGGIGSWLTFLLARQGHDLNVFDFDDVSELNIGGQLYSNAQIGTSKVASINKICEEFAGHSISQYNEKFTTESFAGKVMVAAFDNMEARKIMFEAWLSYYNEVKASEEENEDNNFGESKEFIFIDGRLNAETAEFFCVTDRKSAERWLETWFPDEKVEDAPCTFKATSHCASLLASMIVGALNNFVANRVADEMRSVPFKTSIWLPTMTIISED